MPELRPILTSLNGDNSWLFSFPRPAEDPSDKAYYHVVFEPWLNGPVTVLSTWFVHFLQTGTPAASTQVQIEDLIRSLESEAGSTEIDNPIDAVLLGFHYNDHTHEPTLRDFSKEIPIIATPEAAAIVRKLDHFKSITTFHNSTAEAPFFSAKPLPTWLRLSRFVGHHELNYCLAMTWSHSQDGVRQHETILQSPHGLREVPEALTSFLKARGRPLAMLHGMKESYALGLQNTFGAKSGLRLFRAAAAPRYWVQSHDMPLQYLGTFMRLIGVHDVRRTLQWALDQESSQHEQMSNEVIVSDVPNGGRLVLYQLSTSASSQMLHKPWMRTVSI